MIEAQHGAGVVVDDLFVVGVHQERHGSAGGSRSGFDHVGHVPLVVGLIEEIEFLARVRGVLGEVEVTTVRDPFELIPAPREQVLNIARTRAVVAQFVIVMGPQLDLRRIHAEVEIPVHTGLAPVLVPLLTFRRRDKNSISICSNSRVRNTKLPGVISFRNDFPIWAIPNGGRFRLVLSTLAKLMNMPCAVSGRR